MTTLHRLKKLQKDRGQIYFITDESAIKIGFSKRPAKRMGNLQSGHPKPLKLIGSIDACAYEELIIHRRFDHLRLKGEWFRIEEELLDFIEQFEKDGTLIDPKETLLDERTRERPSKSKTSGERNDAQ
jgi:hypothetical protein